METPSPYPMWRSPSQRIIQPHVQQKANIVLLSGNNHLELANSVAKHIGITLCNATVGKFSNGETSITIMENVREMDVFIIQPTATSPNDSIMELLILIDAVRRASAKRVTAIIPCFGYSRSDKKEKSRVPITAKLVANMLERAGADRVLTVDFHMNQLQGFFNIPVDNLYAEPILMKYIQENIPEEKVIVALGVAGVHRAKRMADRLEVPLAIIHFGSIEPGETKENVAKERSETVKVVGDIKGKVAIMLNDIIDTCDVELAMAKALKAVGAVKIYLIVTHGIFASDAAEKIKDCAEIQEVVVTNTVPTSLQAYTKCPKIKVLDISAFLARAIRIIHDGESISSLFTEDAS